MEEHTRLFEALCRIFVKKIKREERKEDVAKYADEIKKIWEVSVLVDSPNMHPRFIWIQHKDQLPVGLLTQLVERWTSITEFKSRTRLNFFSGLISTTSSVVFIAARIA